MMIGADAHSQMIRDFTALASRYDDLRAALANLEQDNRRQAENCRQMHLLPQATLHERFADQIGALLKAQAGDV